ncbi:MAG: glycogen/starch synthase [Prevotellaceae bacterium]|jgi:glycosyltransferase involved in cell wall biosynthesis|nr:glycogen/starch synthase [Prevotellaceae bacterium]
MDYILETSWEVCNKVGGIYTVLSSRARILQEELKDNLIFIGPDFNNKNPDFTEDKTLFAGWQKHAVETEGLKIRVGRWNVPGNPVAVLVDFKPFFEQKDAIYSEFWERYKVESLYAYGDYDESSMFGYASGKVVESFYRFNKLDKQKVIAHFNEWTTGFGALYLKHTLPSVATMFTTHATSIGRSIAGNGKPLYDYLEAYNGDQMARELNMVAKHSVEKITAHQVDCFTTVSDITAKECKSLLERKPDVVTPNGFENNFIPPVKELKAKQKKAREHLKNIAEALFGYELSDDALFVGTSGRYEYKNKGIDVFIDALHQLDNKKGLAKEVVAFILVPAHISGVRLGLIGNMTVGKPYQRLENPYVTHKLVDREHDPVSNALAYFHLGNRQEQSVKVVFVPSYINATDPLFKMTYYDLLPGLDLTVFPSYYEPWGYTPLESVAFSIPTITTNLSGFGQWVKKLPKWSEGKEEGLDTGVAVVPRSDYNYYNVAEEIADLIIDFSVKSTKNVNHIRKSAFEISQQATWDKFIAYYKQAYNIALTKKIK